MSSKTQIPVIERNVLLENIKTMGRLSEIFVNSSVLRRTGNGRCEKMQGVLCSYKCILVYLYENIYKYGNSSDCLLDAETTHYMLVSVNLSDKLDQILSNLSDNWNDILQSVNALKTDSSEDKEKLIQIDEYLNRVTKTMETLCGKTITKPISKSYNPYKITENDALANGHYLPDLRDVFINELMGPILLANVQHQDASKPVCDYAIRMIKSYYDNAGFVPMKIVDIIVSQIEEIAYRLTKEITWNGHKGLKELVLSQIYK